MSRKANAQVIGIFVLGAAVLLAIGVLLLGGSALLRKTNRYVLFFEGTAGGLQRGSAVEYGGVAIGKVLDLRVVLKEADDTFYVPVTIEIDPARIGTEKKTQRKTGKAILADEIKRGLRAVPELKSIVTGQRVVNLVYRPETPVRLVKFDTEYPQLPTLKPPGLEQLKESLEGILSEKNSNHVSNILAGLDRVVNDPRMKKMVGDAHQTVLSVGAAADRLGRASDRVEQRMSLNKGELVPTVNEALAKVSKLVQVVEKRINELSDGLVLTTRSATAALDESKRTISTVHKQLQPDSRLPSRLNQTLGALSRAAAAMESLANYLERNPNALILGKQAK